MTLISGARYYLSSSSLLPKKPFLFALIVMQLLCTVLNDRIFQETKKMVVTIHVGNENPSPKLIRNVRHYVIDTRRIQVAFSKVSWQQYYLNLRLKIFFLNVRSVLGSFKKSATNHHHHLVFVGTTIVNTDGSRISVPFVGGMHRRRYYNVMSLAGLEKKLVVESE